MAQLLVLKVTHLILFFSVGGLVYGNSFGQGLQYHEWISFMSDNEFCFRACVGAGATKLCNHVYDLMGCHWVCFSNTPQCDIFLSTQHIQNIPANYEPKQFENCDGEVA
jgi:hypothetical protein